MLTELNSSTEYHLYNNYVNVESGYLQINERHRYERVMVCACPFFCISTVSGITLLTSGLIKKQASLIVPGSVLLTITVFVTLYILRQLQKLYQNFNSRPPLKEPLILQPLDETDAFIAFSESYDPPQLPVTVRHPSYLPQICEPEYDVTLEISEPYIFKEYFFDEDEPHFF